MQKSHFKDIGVSFVIGATGYLLEGYTLQHYWTWFILSVWNLNPLTLSQSVGLIILIRFLNFRHSLSDEDLLLKNKKEILWRSRAICLIHPIIALMWGFLFHLALNGF